MGLQGSFAIFGFDRKGDLDQIAFVAVGDILQAVVDLGKLVIVGFGMVVRRIVVKHIRNAAQCVAGSVRGSGHRGIMVGRQLVVVFIHLGFIQLKGKLAAGLRQGIAVFVHKLLNGLQHKGLILGGEGIGKGGKLCRRFVRKVLHGGSRGQVSLLVIGDGNGHTVDRTVVRDTDNAVGGDDLVDVIDVGAGLGVGDVTEIERDMGARSSALALL